MKKNLFYIALLCWSVLPVSAVQRVPFELDFSTPAERAKWHLIQSPDTVSTSWVVGQDPDYAYGDNYMLYVSNDGGATRAYNPTYAPSYRSYKCTAYYPLDTLPTGTYTVEYRYRGMGSWSSAVGVAILPNEPKASNSYYYNRYYSTDISGKWWKEAAITYNSDGKSKHYLCVFFECSARTIPDFPEYGYAVDAIQIYPQEAATPFCAQRPLMMEVKHTGGDLVLEWAGNASEYQLEYFMNDTSLNTRYRVDNITSTSYQILPETMPEGSYTFRVRSICSRDTSSWAAIDYQLVYDISKHCMDYLNFNDPNVQAQRGYTWNPGYYQEVIDRGFLSESSRHTIHNYPRDYDARTNYQLRTFPVGEPAALRLGNWQSNSEAENIIYTMDVTPEKSILQLRYALVMQLPGHSQEQQPRFTLEFLDVNGNLIDSCGYVDFTASEDLEGWHVVHKEGETDVIWKDWSTVGLNMRDYVGETVKARITTKDCSEGAHFGYAYFTMGCSSGTIQGARCGEKPDHFTVDEGFYYRWYKKYDSSKTVLGTDRTFEISDPLDTATYCVDMINMLKPECYFTLEVSSLAYIPHSHGAVKYVPSECKNYIQLSDSSTIQGVYWKDGKMIVARNAGAADDIVWDLGNYGTTTEHSPKIAMPDAGDTLHIVLHTYMENRTCEDSCIFDLVVPSVGTARTINTYYFCRGGAIEWNGRSYKEEIAFSDTLTGSNGCDSISTVALRFFQVDTVNYYDTICAGDSLVWNGQVLSQGGEYFAAIKSATFDCDSVHNILYLHRQPYLNMSLDYTTQSVCMNGGTITVPFSVAEGDLWTYDLVFPDKVKEYGYTDRMAQVVDPASGMLVIDLADSPAPGMFEASLVFHNMYCDSMVFPISFGVNYDPDTVITQRWNDFLSVRKSAYDYYGGFADYQWYKDGEAIAGQTGSQLYLPDEGLDPGSSYAVELTRLSDGMRVRTCPYYPTVEPESVTWVVYPTVIRSASPEQIHIRSPKEGRAELFDRGGGRVAAWTLRAGDNSVAIPAERGIYMLYVITVNGERTARKILVL